MCHVARLNKCRRLYIYGGIWAGLTSTYFPLCSLIWSPEFTLSIVKAVEKYLFILWSMTKAVSHLIGRFGFWFPWWSFPCLSFPFTCFQAWFFRMTLSDTEIHILIQVSTSWTNFQACMCRSNNVKMIPQHMRCQIVSQDIHKKTTTCPYIVWWIMFHVSREKDFQRCLFPKSAVRDLELWWSRMLLRDGNSTGSWISDHQSCPPVFLSSHYGCWEYYVALGSVKR